MSLWGVVNVRPPEISVDALYVFAVIQKAAFASSSVAWMFTPWMQRSSMTPEDPSGPETVKMGTVAATLDFTRSRMQIAQIATRRRRSDIGYR